MEAMRESWTDDRLDCLNHRVDDGFKPIRPSRLPCRIAP